MIRESKNNKKQKKTEEPQQHAKRLYTKTNTDTDTNKPSF